MSMSVDNGFRFVTSDLMEVHRLLAAYRPEIRRQSHETRLRFLADRAVTAIDRAVLAGEAAPRPLSMAYRKLSDQLSGIERGNPDPEVDRTFAVYVLPWDGRVYGAVSTCRDEWARHLIGQAWAEPFDYTDSCDQQEVPAEEYARRREVWDGICRQDPGTRLSGCGFKVEFHPSVEPGTPEEILALVPNIARRARVQARDRVILARAEATAVDGVATMQNTIQAALWFTDPEGQAVAAAEAMRIEPFLPPLTRSLLLDGYEPP